ncbi:spermatogenesis-associated protein 31D4-like [Chionomys nivalis]|uniref:spermatogenesis-associated protein 31D4-like n=1 Tax=Chionomys nivalis TaxID=269649 RepID=UPI002594B140|nr:spermatogenesis-associated protein 31D4-like [Chionomys nivalis]
MEKVLSFLNSTTEPWLRLGHLSSAFPDTYPKCIFLSAVGVLLLFLRYLLLKPFLPTRSNPAVRKQQGEARKRRRTSFKEFRILHRETQERRKLLSVVQSPFGQLYDASHFRRALCPDPRCDVCNGAKAKVSHLLSEATPEDGAASASSVASTASVTETSFTLSPTLSPSPLGCQISSLSPTPPPPPPSVTSTHKVAPLEDTHLCTPQGDSLPSEPVLLTSVDFFPQPPPLPQLPPPPQLGHIPPHPLPTLPQTEEPLQLEISPFLVGSPSEQIVNATTNKESCGGMSEFPPSQSECLVNRHSSEAFWGGQPTIYFPMPGKPSFPNPKVLALLERQDQSQSDFLMLRDDKEKAETFQFKKTLKTWKEISESASGLQSSGVSLPLRGSEGGLQELMVHQGLVQTQTSEDQLEPRVIQHFWGLPYLHSESVNTVTTLSTRSSTCIWFNSTPHSSVLTHPTPLSLPESQSQTLAQSQSQIVCLPRPVPVTASSSQSQLRICEVYFHTSQDKTKALLQSEIRHLEWNVTTEEERVWALPMKVQTSQTKVCLLPSTPSLVRQSSKVRAPRSVSPEDFSLSDAFRKKLEYHLWKRLTLQRWGLPQRIFKAQPRVHPDLAQSSMSSAGLSGVSLFQPQDSKDWQDTVLNQPGSSQESLSLDGKMVETQGQSSEIVQRYPWGNCKGAPDNGLPSNSETNLQRHQGSLSGKPSGTSQVSQCQEKLKTALQKPLVSHLNETNKGQRAGTASRAGHCPLPFTSHVDNEEHEAQRQSCSDNKDRHAKSIYMTKPVLHQASMVLDNTSMKESEGSKHSPDVPRISTEAAPVPLGKRLDSGKTVLGLQGAKVNGKSIFVSDKISSIVKGGQLSVLQPQHTKILNTNQGKITQGADGNTTKAQNTLGAGRALKEITGPQESQTSDCNSQVSRQGKFKKESRLPIQALGPPRDKLPASDEFAYRHFLMSDWSPSRGPMMVSQVQRQVPRMLPHVLGKDQNKDISPSVKRVCPAPWKMEELGAGVPRPGTLQASGKSCHAQDSPTQGHHGEKPTHPLPGKALTPPEHQFRKHVKHFLQWLSPDRRGKVQETFPQKGSSPPSPGQDPALFKGRATFPGTTIAQRAMRDPRKVSKEQLGHRQSAADTMRHPVPFSPLTKPVIIKPKNQSWVSAEPAQGPPFQRQATYPKASSPRPYNQATAVVGQKRWVKDRVSQSQKSVFLQPNPPAPYRGPELHQNVISRRAGQLPQMAPPFAVGTVLADLSRLCEQKILAQNFNGKGFLPQK